MARPDEFDTMEILSLYEVAWADTQKMLAAATSEDWDNLVSLEQSRGSRIAQIMQADKGAMENREFLLRKAELIRSILSADERIKLLTNAWLDELKKTLNTIGIDKRMQQAYASAERA